MVVAGLVGAGSFSKIVTALLESRRNLRKAKEARDSARAALLPQEDRALQESAIELHAQQLRTEINGLRARALASFIPGLLLCICSLIGPLIAFRLAEKHGKWEFMIGGSTLAAVLLAAGSALLRHDNKVRDQIQASQSELLYFSRLKTGLDCAATLSADQYRRGLEMVTAHLLAAPPSLSRPAQHVEKASVAALLGADTPGNEGHPAIGSGLSLVKEAGETLKALLPGEIKEAKKD
jgi:hypothetical protein